MDRLPLRSHAERSPGNDRATVYRQAGRARRQGCGHQGEHGIRIWAPSIPRKTEEQDDETEEQPTNKSKRRQSTRAFHLVPVFDVSQTEGDPLPAHPCKPLDDDPANAAEIIRRTNQLAAAIVAKGVRIIDDEDGAAIGRGGYWDATNRLIAIASTDNNAARFRVLLHETAHMLADHSPTHEATRRDRETVAELAAHIAAGALGYDTSTASVGYVATWAGGDLARIKANMTEAMRVVRELLAMMPDDGASKPKPSQAPALKIERPTSAAAVIAGEPLTFNFCQECGQPLTDKTQPLCPECQTPEPTPPAGAAKAPEQNANHPVTRPGYWFTAKFYSGQAVKCRSLGIMPPVNADDPISIGYEYQSDGQWDAERRRITGEAPLSAILAGRYRGTTFTVGAPQPPTDPAPASARPLTERQEQNRKSAEEMRARREQQGKRARIIGEPAASVTERAAKPLPGEEETPHDPNDMAGIFALSGITAENADNTISAAQEWRAAQFRAMGYYDDPQRCDREHGAEVRQINSDFNRVYERVTAVRNADRRNEEPEPTSAPIVIAQTRHVDASGQEIEGTARTIAAEQPARKRSTRKPKEEPKPTPRTDELERQAKSGQPVSILAIADAINADKAENDERAEAEQSAAAPAVPTIAPRAAVLTKELKAALSAIKPAILGKTALPILKCVRIDARDGQLTISATNLEIGITRTIPASVDAPFSVCFDYKQFAAAVPAGNDVIHITPDGAGAMAKIEKQSADDFPVLPEPSGTSAEVDAAELAAAVNAVTHAAAKDDIRPVLAAVNIRVKDGFAELAAADGFRLAVSQPFPLALPDGSYMPPARALAAWAGLKLTGKVRLTVSPNRANCWLDDGTTRLQSRMIDGTFPDYKQIIPRESAVTVRLDPRQLADACKQIAPIVKDNNDVLRLTIARESGAEECRLTASGKSSDGAEIALNVPLLAATMPHQTDAPPYQIAFNVKYLSDVCKHAAGPLTFGFNTPSHAARITDDVTTFVLMPMTVKD